MTAVKTLMSLLVSFLLLGTQMVYTAVPVLDAPCAKTGSYAKAGCGCCACPTKQCCLEKNNSAPAPVPGIPPSASQRIDLQGLAVTLVPLLEAPAAVPAQTSFSVFYSVAASVPLYVRDCAYLI